MAKGKKKSFLQSQNESSPSIPGPQTPITRRSKRGLGYSEEETMNLLLILKEHQPIGSMAWEKVNDLHNVQNPNTPRTTDSLKRKFKELYQAKPKTGNPQLPEKVKLAKDIREAMCQRGQISNFSSSSKDVSRGILSDGEDTESTCNLPVVEGMDNESLVPLPLSRKRTSSTAKKESKVEDILEIYKLQIIQAEKNREAQEILRQEERKEMIEKAKIEREERREEAKFQREIEAQRHDSLMKMLAAVVAKNKE